MKVNEVNRQRSQTGRDRIHNLFILDRMDVCILFFFLPNIFLQGGRCAPEYEGGGEGGGGPG